MTEPSEPTEMGPAPTHGRIPLLAHNDAVAAARSEGVTEWVCDLNIFRVLFHHPPLARRFNDFLAPLLLAGRLDGRLRELAILRVGWRTASVYEWTQHWRMAPDFGCSTDDMDGVRDWEAHDFGPLERDVLAATDELLDDDAVSPATWGRLEARLGVEELMELVMVVGAYRMVAGFLRSTEVPLEAGVEPWPPDGTPPG